MPNQHTQRKHSDSAFHIQAWHSHPQQQRMLAFLSSCEWRAAGFLHALLAENRFEDVLGPEGHLYFLMAGEEPVGFITLTQRDCIADESLFPWLGFLYTVPQWRGQGCAGMLLRHAVAEAGRQGYRQVYLATDHVGLYDRHGFTYVESRPDVWGEMSRIYTIRL